MSRDKGQGSTFGGNRRDFLRKTASTAAILTGANLLGGRLVAQGQAAPSAGVLGANSRINVAYIGTGRQGMAHLRVQKKFAKDNNIAQVAVCDLYQRRLDEARAFAGLEEKDAYLEHERLLERKDVDAVIISTVDNWHAQCSIDAVKAGKHVFCEKPMTRYLGEAYEVYDAVKASGKVYVIGSQGCMDPKWHKAAEWVKEGKLGPLVWGQGSYCRNNPKNSEWSYPVDPTASEQNLNWKKWLGRAPKIPFTPDHFFSWHKFYAYNSGIIGNLLPHRFQPLMIATGDVEYPRRVVCTGTRKVSTDRDITDTTHILAEFPSGLTLFLVGTTVNEQGLPEMIRGRKATVRFATSQNRAELSPESIFTEEMDAEAFADPRPTERIEVLERHFFECIRDGKTPVANIDLAMKAHTVLTLAEMSERMGLALFYDPQKRQIKTGDGKVVPPLDYDTAVPSNA
jgi:predicted dehydrogenase